MKVNMNGAIITDSVVDAVAELQNRGTAEDIIRMLHELMEFILRDENYDDDRERLRYAREIIGLQNLLRCFIADKEDEEPKEEKGGVR